MTENNNINNKRRSFMDWMGDVKSGGVVEKSLRWATWGVLAAASATLVATGGVFLLAPAAASTALSVAGAAAGTLFAAGVAEAGSMAYNDYKSKNISESSSTEMQMPKANLRGLLDTKQDSNSMSVSPKDKSISSNKVQTTISFLNNALMSMITESRGSTMSSATVNIERPSLPKNSTQKKEQTLSTKLKGNFER